MGTKKYLKIKNVFALSSAAAALEIIAMLLKLKKGDEIIIPAHTYCASAIPFARNQAKIVWADIDFKTRLIDLNDVRNKEYGMSQSYLDNQFQSIYISNPISRANINSINLKNDYYGEIVLNNNEKKSFIMNNVFFQGLVNQIDDFLSFTFETIKSNKPHKIASAFTFGREDLIPDMFTSIVKEYNTSNKLDAFIYYLNRHIELDGGEHGPLALELIADLCANDEKKWEEVEETAVKSLIARKKLWDAVSSQLT